MSRIAVLVVAAAVLLLPSLAQAASPELSTTDRLKDRRYVAAGDHSYVMGYEDGTFPAQGWHVAGEMGGVWSQPLKLIDGLWFGVGDEWVGPATKFTSGWGYVRMDLPPVDGLELSRTDFAPDGHRAALFGLTVRNPGAARTVTINVDAHSELIGHYPWAWTTPSAPDADTPDTGAYEDGALVFGEKTDAHDWAAVVAADAQPAAGEAASATADAPDETYWGSQAPREPCQDEGVPDEEKAPVCDDSATGRGAGGRLTYELDLPANGERTLWVGVAGSDEGPGAARTELHQVLQDPGAALSAKVAERVRWSRWTRLSLPGDPLLADAIDWGKQNMLDLTQRAEHLRIRDVDEGKAFPDPVGTVDAVRFIGAGYPDYPWLFATDGEFTAFAAVAAGQFEAIKDHARALRDVSLVLNGDSGKVVHEVVADGSVYFGALDDAGNTDETAKFPSMVALLWRWTGDNGFRDEMYGFTKRNVEYIYDKLDTDGDGWPEGLGNVERTGMGEEKLDNTVSTIRALFDLADMATSKGDDATARWARSKGRDLLRRFEGAWWVQDAEQYADSLDDPGDVKVFQKHWIGVTPMEIELTDRGRVHPGLASFEHGDAALAERETPCYSGTLPLNPGLFHTGCEGGPEGKGETDVFSLNTAVMAVGEGNYGRLGAGQQQRYTDANRMLMLPDPDEQPGAMPEIAPSPPPRGRNIDRCSRCRSMVMQAWGNYGTLWPVVHQQLGVRPDLGRGRLEVVPQLPSDAPIAGRDIRLGGGAVDVAAARSGTTLTTKVDTGDAPVRTLYIGATLPRDARVKSVKLDGRSVRWRSSETNRGLEVTVRTGPGAHRLSLTVRA